MKGGSPIWGGGILLAALLQCAAAEELFWRTGESLTGQLLGASADSLTFQPELTELFGSPVNLALERLRRVRFDARPTERLEAFQVRLTDGSLLLADIRGRTADEVWLSSAWLGAFKVRADRVEEVRRVRGPGVILAAPGPTVVWQERPTAEESDTSSDAFDGDFDPFGDAPPELPVRVQPKPSAPGLLSFWQTSPGGGLRTVSWNQKLLTSRAFSDEVPLPRRCRLEVVVSATGGPCQFSLQLTAGSGAEVRLETWGDELVLRRGNRFDRCSVDSAVTEGRLAVSVLWDRATGELQLVRPAGDRLIRLAATDPQGKLPKASELGVSLQNLWTNLTLHSLVITEWSGAPLPPQKEAGTEVSRIDGRPVEGRWVGGDDRQMMVATETGTTVSLPIHEVAGVQFQGTDRDADGLEQAGVTLVSQAGERLRGQWQGLQGEPLCAELRRGGSTVPWRAALADVAEILWSADAGGADAPVSTMVDQMKLPGGGRLTGTLESHGDPLPRWKFDGAEEATALKGRSSLKVVLERAAAKAPQSPVVALLHLHSGELVPATVKGLTKAGIEFSAPGLLTTTLAAAEVRAVLFPGAPLITEGFGDPRWQWGTTGGESGKGGLPLIRPGEQLMHPSMMNCSEIAVQFTPSALGISALRLTLNSRGLDAGEDPMRVLVGLVGTEIYCGEASADGQFRQQMQVPWEEGDVRVELRAEGEELVVRVNAENVLRLNFPSAKRVGSGLILETASIWNNEAQELQLTAFEGNYEAGQMSVPGVEPEAMAHALTVPRLRQDDPPQHALIAFNGDVLRGVVEALNASQVRLRSGLERFEIGLDRVAALVFLRKDVLAPSEEEPPAALGQVTAPSHWVELTSGARIGLVPQRWAEDGVVGLHPLVGRVRLPLQEVKRLYLNQAPATSPALEALNGWVLRLAPEPEIPEPEGSGTNSDPSALLGQAAKDFKLPDLGGGEWALSAHKGKVVVIDFWASWCGPCLKAMPDLIQEMSVFSPAQVSFIGVNQAEAAEHVRTFVQTRGWDLSVALDADQAVARQFGVSGIPHTVIVGPDGRVVWVKSGYRAKGAAAVAKVVKDLLPPVPPGE